VTDGGSIGAPAHGRADGHALASARVQPVVDYLTDGQLTPALKGLLEIVADLDDRENVPHPDRTLQNDVLQVLFNWRHTERSLDSRGITYEVFGVERAKAASNATSLLQHVKARLHAAPSLPQGPSGSSIISLANAECRVGAFSLAVDTFEARSGSITVVVGPNASGKTTLLRCLAGLLWIDRDKRTVLREHRVAYVAQDPPPWGGTLLEYLSRQAAIAGVPAAKNRDLVERTLRILGLEDRDRSYAGEPCAGLSGGIRTRCALAAAMLHQGHALVLDEPLAPLDVMSQQLFLAELRLIATLRGSAIVVTSHHVPELESVADAVYVLRNNASRRWQPPPPDGFHYFEIGCHPGDRSSREEVQRVASASQGIDVLRAYSSMLLLRSRVGREQLVASLGTAQIQYLRDITRSVMRDLHDVEGAAP
jgi:ABC-type nitrate/sulfonate/bicarbonate transport system ATPase subunit